MSQFTLSQHVIVGPNLASTHKPDHNETPWNGVVTNVNKTPGKNGIVVSYSVTPDDPEKLPRSVLENRLAPAG